VTELGADSPKRKVKRQVKAYVVVRYGKITDFVTVSKPKEIWLDEGESLVELTGEYEEEE
jgi:hypothetical protein